MALFNPTDSINRRTVGSGRTTDAISPPEGSTGTPAPPFPQATTPTAPQAPGGVAPAPSQPTITPPAQPSIGTSPTGTGVTGSREEIRRREAGAQPLPAGAIPAPTGGGVPATGVPGAGGQQPGGVPIHGTGPQPALPPIFQGGQPVGGGQLPGGVQPIPQPLGGGVAPNPFVQPGGAGGQPIEGPGGFPGGLPPLGGNPLVPPGTEAVPLQGLGGLLERYLANPSRFDNPTFQAALQSSFSDIDRQAQMAQQAAAADAAQRGVFFGSPLTTAGTDIASEAGRARQQAATQLLMNQAQTYSQDFGQALQAAMGFGQQQLGAQQFNADYALRALAQAFGGAPTIGGTAGQIAGLPGLPGADPSGLGGLGQLAGLFGGGGAGGGLLAPGAQVPSTPPFIPTQPSVPTRLPAPTGAGGAQIQPTQPSIAPPQFAL